MRGCSARREQGRQPGRPPPRQLPGTSGPGGARRRAQRRRQHRTSCLRARRAAARSGTARAGTLGSPIVKHSRRRPTCIVRWPVRDGPQCRVRPTCRSGASLLAVRAHRSGQDLRRRTRAWLDGGPDSADDLCRCGRSGLHQGSGERTTSRCHRGRRALASGSSPGRSRRSGGRWRRTVRSTPRGWQPS